MRRVARGDVRPRAGRGGRPGVPRAVRGGHREPQVHAPAVRSDAPVRRPRLHAARPDQARVHAHAAQRQRGDQLRQVPRGEGCAVRGYAGRVRGDGAAVPRRAAQERRAQGADRAPRAREGLGEGVGGGDQSRRRRVASRVGRRQKTRRLRGDQKSRSGGFARRRARGGGEVLCGARVRGGGARRVGGEDRARGPGAHGDAQGADAEVRGGAAGVGRSHRGDARDGGARGGCEGAGAGHREDRGVHGGGGGGAQEEEGGVHEAEGGEEEARRDGGAAVRD